MTIIITSSPMAQIAADVEAMLRKHMTGPQAQTWLLAGNPKLDGLSPIQAIKTAKVENVYEAAREMCSR